MRVDAAFDRYDVFSPSPESLSAGADEPLDSLTLEWLNEQHENLDAT